MFKKMISVGMALVMCLIKEAGKYEATKRKRRSDDKEYTYYRYSIWYDIEYEINGETKTRNLVVTATDIRHPFGPGSSKNKVGLNVSQAISEIENERYFYNFYLENVRDTLAEEEKEYLISICEQAIKNRYQYSAK